jgi:DNA-binding GntR family transcriptional regulator
VSPEQIAEVLKADILSGRATPGTALRQDYLAERFAVSRIPIRDALRIVAADGLITVTANRTASVVELTPDEVGELYDLRVLLECDLLKRAACALDERALQSIDLVLRRSEIDASTPHWHEGDWAFHAALYAYAQRPRQLKIVEGLRRTSQVFIAAYETLPTKRARWVREHRSLLAHLRRNEVDAALAQLRDHLEGARAHVVNLVSQSVKHPDSSPVNNVIG